MIDNLFSLLGTPTLFAVIGEERIPIEPNSFKAYYNNIGDAEMTFPQDFKVVAGNASARSQEDVEPLSTMSWWCEYGPESGPKDEGAFPTQSCELGRLQTILRFQDCINPDTHEAAYSGRHNLPNTNRCPEGMKRIPQLRFSVRYDASKALPDGWQGEAPLELASGPSYSFHGDFINGWLEEAAENLLLATDKREWQPVEGPLSSPISCDPADPNPDNGTDDWAESVQALNTPPATPEQPDTDTDIPVEAEAETEAGAEENDAVACSRNKLKKRKAMSFKKRRSMLN